MTLETLNEKQKFMLKQRYLMEVNAHTSWEQLDNAETLVSDEELKSFYKDMEIPEDTFEVEYEHSCYSY